jgi:hypothetical protein
MSQDLINWALGLAGSAGGWWLKTVWDSHRVLADKVVAIEVLVAGQYVRRDELSAMMSRIDNKLDAISTKLDSKADKP